MDGNHPIPQDVTHFQFKLVGNLTLKQFGYVIAGAIAGWITISLPLFILLKLPFALIFLGAGLIFAFIPIEGRPADLMLSYFFKALFQPNQYLFQKEGSHNPLVAASNAMRSPQMVNAMQTTQQQMQQISVPQQQMMPTTPPQPIQVPSAPVSRPQVPTPMENPPVMQHAPEVPQPPVSIPTTITTVSNPVTPVSTPSTKPETIPMIPIVTNTVAPSITQEIPPAAPIVTTPEPMPQPNTPIVTQTVQQEANPLQSQLQDTLEQKKQLEEQLAQLKKQLEQNMQASAPTIQEQPAPAPIGVSSIVKTMPVQPKTAQPPMVSEFPNIVMGVVKDSRGNVLPNILIEVKDSDDNPVRAFKTNALGQFASATPLLNGIYTILFEDPAETHRFDAIQIEVRGEIMQPIEVISKDEREDLRKELFG